MDDKNKRESCPHCGGDQITKNIAVGLTAEAGNVGLDYRTVVLITGTEPLLADLCAACGTVTRLHVKNVSRKWLTNDE